MLRKSLAVAILLISSVSSALNFDSSVPPEIQKQMLSDLDTLFSLQGSGATPLHESVYGQLDGGVYKVFFESRIASVGLSDCGSPVFIACTMVTDWTRLLLNKTYLTLNIPLAARWVVIFHETRHAEKQNKFWDHVRCPEPFVDKNGKVMRSIWSQTSLSGVRACDNTAIGAFGTTSLMMKNIQHLCTNCTEKVKMDAGLYADDQALRIINSTEKQKLTDDALEAERLGSSH